MKKYLALLAVAALGLTIACGKASPEAEAKAIMNDMIKLVDTTTEKLDKAATGKDAADALIEFSNGMKALTEKGKEFDKKNPNVNVESGEAFKAERDKMMQSMTKFTEVSTKVMMKFKDSKELLEAAQKMAQ